MTGTSYTGRLRGDGLRVAVVTSRFNDLVTDRLRAGCIDGLTRHGVDRASIVEASVPGALELPLAAQRLAASGDVDAVVCIGAVIRGSTDHHIHVGGQCAAGLARVQLDTGVPVIFGVLTTDDVAAALERAGAKMGNKGFEAAATAVEMVDLLRQLPKSAG
ncbi:MAG: 6,7-dimethyl-8-ribityllumazine synthase [Acidimicrobiales bacterium]